MNIHLSIALLIILIFVNDGCKPIKSPLTVKICNQVWSTKNLDVDKYRNGDPIPKVTNSKQWDTLTTGAYCYYNNSKDSLTNAIYGKLYNWYAVHDERGLAPEGWHIPSYAEFDTLVKCVGGNLVAGSQLKSIAVKGEPNIPDYWMPPNSGATNNSGFTGLPGGWRAYGVFNMLGYQGTWWSATENNPLKAWNLNLYYATIQGHLAGNNKQSGFSVRCVKNITK